MYIYKTTAAERVDIANSLGTIFPDIMRARRLLMKVLSDFFEDAEQKPIGRSKAEDVRDILQAINGLLWQSELVYSLTVEDEMARGCNAYYSKKYLAEHEEGLNTYRAAKASINKLLAGVKLPRMEKLKQERRELAEKKKALRAEYRQAQQDMREIVAVKGNVDHLLGVTGREDKEQAR